MPSAHPFTDAIRRASGRSAPEANAAPVVGDVGIGRGGSAIERRPAPPVSMTALIRAERALRAEERETRARAYDG